MESLSSLIMLAAVIVGVVLLIKLLSKPIRWILKLLLNTVMGFVILFVVNSFGSILGIELEINLLNALIVGFLGVPGVILLIILNFIV